MPFFINEIEKIIKDNNGRRIALFVDMDGVMADYRFGEGINIKENVAGVYLSKRPIKTVIETLSKISAELNLESHILSSCLYPEQVCEKNQWLDKYAPFFEMQNRNIVISPDFAVRGTLKIELMQSVMNRRNFDIAILVEDTHEILFEAIKILKNRVIPFHIITLID